MITACQSGMSHFTMAMILKDKNKAMKADKGSALLKTID
jgi:hypothetical protein